MDIDTTVQGLSLNIADIQKTIFEIGSMALEDNVSFDIVSVETIMDEFNYPGVRVHMNGLLGKIKQPIKIDISTDDVITPGATEYCYELLFEK